MESEGGTSYLLEERFFAWALFPQQVCGYIWLVFDIVILGWLDMEASFHSTFTVGT